jgi:hypothetical protein
MCGGDEAPVKALLMQDVELARSGEEMAFQSEAEITRLRARVAELEELIEALKLEFGTSQAYAD